MQIPKIYMISIEFQKLIEANRKTKTKLFLIFLKIKISFQEAIPNLKNTRLKSKSSLKWRIMVHHRKTCNLEKIVWQLQGKFQRIGQRKKMMSFLPEIFIQVGIFSSYSISNYRWIIKISYQIIKSINSNNSKH